MSKENELFKKDADFRGLVKKAKRNSMIRTIIISLLISIVLFFSLFWLNSFLTQKSINKNTMEDSLWNEVHGANIEDQGTSYNYSLFSATGKTEFNKKVDGIPIPWAPSERVYTFLGKSRLVTSMGASTGSQPIGSDRVPFYYNGKRVIEFFHPQLDYKQVVGDREIIPDIHEDKAIELAFSFDKSYTLEEVDEVFKEHIAWLWVNTYDEDEIRRDNEHIQEHYERDNTIIGDSAYGFRYNGTQPDRGAESFIMSLEQLAESDSYKSIATSLMNKITNNHEKKLTPENLEIIGAVVTGPSSELLKYNDVPFVRAVTLGVTVDKY